MSDLVPEMRVGDRERRDVDARLQGAVADGVLTLSEYDQRAAQCWAARTRTELERVVHDLPAAEPTSLPAPRSGQALVHSRRPEGVRPARRQQQGRGVLRRVLPVAVAAAVAVSVVQVVTADDGAAVFGSRSVNVTDQNAVDVGVLFGSVEVVVDDNARVRTKGAMVFGSVDCEQACEGGTGPEVVINGNGAFGSIEVVREGDRAAEDSD